MFLESFPTQDRDYINPSNIHQNLSSVNAQSSYSSQHHPNLHSHLNSAINGSTHHNYQSNSTPNLSSSFNSYSNNSYSSNNYSNNYHQSLQNHHPSSSNSHLPHSQPHSYHQAPMNSSYMNSTYSSHSNSLANSSYSNYVGVINKSHIPSNNYSTNAPPTTQSTSLGTQSLHHPTLSHSNNYQFSHSNSIPSSSTYPAVMNSQSSSLLPQASATPIVSSSTVLPNENSQEELASINRRYNTNSTPDVLAGFNQSDLDLLSASPLLFPSAPSNPGITGNNSTNGPVEESKSSKLG